MKKSIVSFVLSAVFVFFTALTPVYSQSDEPFILIDKPTIGTAFEIQSDVTISGTATPNSKITLITEEGEYAELTSKDDGTWSFTIPTVSEGSATIQARVETEIDELSSKSAIANVTYYVKPPPSSASNVTKLAQTGVVTYILILTGLLLLSLAIWTIIDYRRHKRPLEQASSNINYSFWHHLKVVSIPLLRYRLSINLYKRAPNKSERVRRY